MPHPSTPITQAARARGLSTCVVIDGLSLLPQLGVAPATCFAFLRYCQALVRGGADEKVLPPAVVHPDSAR